MRIFASDKVAGLMKKLGMQQGEAIEHPWVSRSIENAQRKVEGHNFDIRKQLLEYDDVANDQRKVVYQQRNEMMTEDDLSEMVESIREDVIEGIVSTYVLPGTLEEQWDIEGLQLALEEATGQSYDIQQWLDEDDQLNEYKLPERIIDELKAVYAQKEQQIGASELRRFEKYVLLKVLDAHWKEHLAAMDYLRQSINLRAMAQKNPKQEYKRESFEMFAEMLEQIKQEVISTLCKVEIRTQEEIDALEQQQQMPAEMNYEHASTATMQAEEETEQQGDNQQQPFVRTDKKIGRNDPCYCGSGKKYKQCHGKLN
jgi:preprotein translocase subunit SecA